MKKLAVALIVLALLAAVAWWLAPRPSGMAVTVRDLPWEVTVFADGSSEVFGVHLGVTTLRALTEKLEAYPDVALFQQADGTSSLEAYFGRVRLGVLDARLVAVLAAEPEQLAAWAKAPTSDKPMPSGARKLELSEDELLQTFGLSIMELTYVPYAQYEEELVLRRFGEPAERVSLGANSAYWLYPERGLALLLDREGREVLEYSAPARFADLRARVLQRADQARAGGA